MKNKTNKPLAKVFHFSLQGKREDKYEFLNQNSMESVPWIELDYKEPYYFFVPKDFAEENEYVKGFKIDELLINNNTGIQTKCDELSIHFNKIDLEKVVYDFKSFSIKELKKKYPGKTDSSGWNFENAVSDLKNNKIHYTKILYRPFDIRHSLYTGKSSGFIGRPRTSTMSHMVDKQNLGLITLRINGEGMEFVCLITDHIIEKGSLPKGNYSIFPLYLYPDTNAQQSIDTQTERTPNLNIEIVNQIAEKLGLRFVPEKETSPNPSKGEGQDAVANICDGVVKNNLGEQVLPPSFGGEGGGQNDKDTFAPIDILDYIYAVLHSPTYREKYKEFLKIDFPRVPYPSGRDAMHCVSKFWQLVKLGGELRQIHLLESSTVEKYITQYPIDGNNEVVKPAFKGSDLTGFQNLLGLGRVYINETQYFDHVPEVAWNFYIGGYQPAQKWLKDRKERKLEFDDILHYQKIIVALTETDRIMKAIDKIEIE